MSNATYDLKLLEQSRAKWDRSPAVRSFYSDVFTAMMSWRVPGPTLDLGSGIGVMKDFYPDVETSDIAMTPYVDRAVSCYEISSTGRNWSNLTAMDMLHHLRCPLDFFSSGSTALRPGGRIILAEPAATSWGRLFYKLFHHEPMAPDVLQPPFRLVDDNQDGEFANMGMCTALFRIHREATDGFLREAGLFLRSVIFRDVIAYPLTGGFSRPQLLPTFAVRCLLRLESTLPQLFLKRVGLRMIIVLEKR